MMDIIQHIMLAVSLLLGAAAGAGALYLTGIAVAARLRPGREPPPAAGSGTPPAATRFAILVPAHNEELLLPRLLGSLKTLDYPAADYEVSVVADNCDDETARIAFDHGAQCLVRSDPQRRGKGWALNYGIERIGLDRFDAVVIIDADNVASPNLLRVFDRRLAAGAQAIQAFYGATPPRGPVGYLLSVENAVENSLFYAARQKLGLPGVLRGTGMCLRSEVARRYRWDEAALAEDIAYSLRLAEDGIRVQFAPEAAVAAPEPETLSQAWVQRARWSRGIGASALGQGLRLLWRGVRTRRAGLVELAASSLVTSKSALMAAALAALLITAFLPATWLTRSAQVLAAGSLALLAAYLAAGILLTRPTPRQALYLVYAPALLGWRVVCHLWAAAHGPNQWTRTGR